MRIQSKFEPETDGKWTAASRSATHLVFFLSLSIIKNSGYLVSVDAYMNLQLASTQEFIDGKLAGDLGEVLIRCNNVLYVRGAPDDGGGGGGAS